MNEQSLEIIYPKDLIDKFNKEIHESKLDNIAFDLDQLKELRKMYNKHAFDDMRISFGSMIMNIKVHLKKEKEEYEKRYGKKPDIKDAWRVFNRNRADVDKSGRKTRDTALFDTEFEHENLGL